MKDEKQLAYTPNSVPAGERIATQRCRHEKQTPVSKKLLHI